MKFKVLLFISALFLLVSWMPKRYYYFYKETKDYEQCLDSLHGCYGLNLQDITTWDSVKYFTNEGKVATIYSIHGSRNDSVFIISVSNYNGENYGIKMRIEIGK